MRDTESNHATFLFFCAMKADHNEGLGSSEEMLILAPSFIRRAYHRKQCNRLLKEYRDSCKEYSEVRSEEPETLPDNVVDLKEYKERRYSDI